MGSKSIDVQFFAAYRDAAGVGEIAFTTEAKTAEELFVALKVQYPQLERFPAAKVAINDNLADWSTNLIDGDRVLLFPPVAGG